MTNDAINELLNALKEEFLVTLPERLTEIESLILALPDNADVENLLRIVHSLKGAAGTHGCHIFTKICHQMEDMMRILVDTNRIHSQKAVEFLLEFNDLQNNALENYYSNNDNFSSIDSRLSQLHKSIDNSQTKVLIVEPSPLYASILVSLLSSDTTQVKVVGDGFLALENLLMRPYDIVLTAMEVPTLNGDALLSAVRLSQCKNKEIKAVLITSKSESEIKHSELFNRVVSRSIVNEMDLSNLLSF